MLQKYHQRSQIDYIQAYLMSWFQNCSTKQATKLLAYFLQCTKPRVQANYSVNELKKLLLCTEWPHGSQLVSTHVPDDLGDLAGLSCCLRWPCRSLLVSGRVLETLPLNWSFVNNKWSKTDIISPWIWRIQPSAQIS